MTERAQPPPGIDRVEAEERARLVAPEVSWALRAVTRAASETDSELAHRLALRPIEISAMDHVMTAPSPMGPAELSNRLGISTGSTTELVDRLERAGHLVRRPHEHDRRRIVLEVTQPAVARMMAELSPMFRDLDALAADFSTEERAVVTRYLRGATDVLRAYGAGEHRKA